jgi:hypothetical protein
MHTRTARFRTFYCRIPPGTALFLVFFAPLFVFFTHIFWQHSCMYPPRTSVPPDVFAFCMYYRDRCLCLLHVVCATDVLALRVPHDHARRCCTTHIPSEMFPDFIVFWVQKWRAHYYEQGYNLPEYLFKVLKLYKHKFNEWRAIQPGKTRTKKISYRGAYLATTAVINY